MRVTTSRMSAFTLVELLVVVAIIGLIAGMLLTVLAKTRTAARRTEAREDVQGIVTAWTTYLTDYRKFPDATIEQMTTNVMGILTGTSSNFNTRRLRYMEFSAAELQNGFRDPWGNRYRVAVDNGRGMYDTPGPGYDSEVSLGPPHGALRKYVAAWSYGPDGVQSDDDVVSWQ
jgi:prepilin-type N-terminal cleavage/methylation domain-containing protein